MSQGSPQGPETLLDDGWEGEETYDDVRATREKRHQ